MAVMSVISAYASGLPGVGPGNCSPACLDRSRRVPILRVLVALVVVLCASSGPVGGAENSSLQPGRTQLEETNAAQPAPNWSQIQEQLQATQLAIERTRQETKEAAAHNAQALAEGFKVLQEAFSAQRIRELEALQNSSREMQRSSHTMLLVVATLAGIGFLALLFLSYSQWQTGKNLAALASDWPARRDPGFEVAALGPAEVSAAEKGNLRLLEALQQLDRHLHEFQGVIASGGNGNGALSINSGTADNGVQPDQAPDRSRIPGLLSEGQSMINLDKAEAALACFDEVLSLDPHHAEALVKKGAALERLHKLHEAIECYDKAIAADGSMTIAYLHKGGLCNRLERFKEALECYEKALRTHDQKTNLA